ncbi:hypothetical protein MBLNU230_g1983t1 [Neophaeotheca triangularis]
MAPKANTKAKMVKPASDRVAKGRVAKSGSTSKTSKTKGKIPSPVAATSSRAGRPRKVPDVFNPDPTPAPRASAAKAAPTTKKTTGSAKALTPAQKAAITRANKAKTADKAAKATTKTTKERKTLPAKGPKEQKKAPAKKAAPTKGQLTPAQKAAITRANNKRKREEEAEAPAPSPAPKKVKAIPKGPVLTEPPTRRMDVYVFGEGSAGELGLGPKNSSLEVKRPRFNPNLASDKAGVVQLDAGAMHAVALTRDNKILTWGVNDDGALGRTTAWEGGVRDVDDPEPDLEELDEDDDSGLNPHESTPYEVNFSKVVLPEGTRWTQVVACDSATFALTDDGHVYGWGTFRGASGPLGFRPNSPEKQTTPVLIPEIKDITQLAAGANHILALHKSGRVYGWGAGDSNQLGRKIVERTQGASCLIPREFGLPKGVKNGIVKLGCGDNFSFALNKLGNVYAWGLNNFGQLGMEDEAGGEDAFIFKPQIVERLQGMTITEFGGGQHHSYWINADGDMLFAGRLDSSQSGLPASVISQLPEEHVLKGPNSAGDIITRAIWAPTKISNIEGAVVTAATSTEHCMAVTKEGRAWSWGFNENFQTGQGGEDDTVKEATMLDNKAVREVKITGAATGSQYGMLTAFVDDA